LAESRVGDVFLDDVFGNYPLAGFLALARFQQANWWLFDIIFGGVTGAIATVWFLIGGFKDLKLLFQRLSTIQRNIDDDGTVRKEDHFGN